MTKITNTVSGSGRLLSFHVGCFPIWMQLIGRVVQGPVVDELQHRSEDRELDTELVRLACHNCGRDVGSKEPTVNEHAKAILGRNGYSGLNRTKP